MTDDEGPGLPTMYESYREQLAQAGRLDTHEGVHLLHLARLFDSGNYTASGAATLSKEIRTARDEALAGTSTTRDEMDELEERRQRKISSA